MFAESIELFIEDQGFLPSYDLNPFPSPPPSVRKLCVAKKKSSLLTGEKGGEGGVREEPNHTRARMPGPL